MAELDELFKKLKDSGEFKSFKEEHKESFLYACFFVSEENWQFDYYNPKDGLITTFEVSDSIQVMPIDKAFDDKPKVSELALDKIKVAFNEAMETAKKIISIKYQGDNSFTKTIVILQNLDNKVIWNITLLTSTLKLLNVKLDASSGEVLSDCIESFLSMK